MSREQQNVQNIRAAGSEIANMTQLPALTLLREIAQRRLRAALRTLAAEVEESGVLKGTA